MSWHDHCNQFKYITKRNRYAFVDEFGLWFEVKWGGNFDDTYWIVSERSLNQDQMETILDAMCVRKGIDILTETKSFNKFGKMIVKFKIEW